MIELTEKTPLLIELGFNPSALPGLKSYLELLWRSNQDLNLISRKMETTELIDNHVVDSLLPLKYFPKNLKKVADFGSGGGLPSVIYALQFPETQFFLFEKSPKKQSFLNQLKAIAPNLHVKGEITPKFEKLDLIMARAFKPLNVILELSRSHYESQGEYFLLKGRREKIEEEKLEALKKFKNLNLKITALKSPVLDVERNLVQIGGLL